MLLRAPDSLPLEPTEAKWAKEYQGRQHWRVLRAFKFSHPVYNVEGNEGICRLGVKRPRPTPLDSILDKKLTLQQGVWVQ